jgi:hypothetical protein
MRSSSEESKKESGSSVIVNHLERTELYLNEEKERCVDTIAEFESRRVYGYTRDEHGNGCG